MKTATQPSVSLMFRAFSDDTRLRILALLVSGEVCVCDIVGVLDVPQPTASRQLAYLRRAGLVVARKDGLWNYYRLTEPTNELHTKLLECLACCITAKPILERDRKKLAKCRTDCC